MARLLKKPETLTGLLAFLKSPDIYNFPVEFMNVNGRTAKTSAANLIGKYVNLLEFPQEFISKKLLEVNSNTLNKHYIKQIAKGFKPQKKKLLIDAQLAFQKKEPNRSFLEALKEINKNNYSALSIMMFESFLEEKSILLSNEEKVEMLLHLELFPLSDIYQIKYKMFEKFSFDGSEYIDSIVEKVFYNTDIHEILGYDGMKLTESQACNILKRAAADFNPKVYKSSDILKKIKDQYGDKVSYIVEGILNIHDLHHS